MIFTWNFLSYSLHFLHVTIGNRNRLEVFVQKPNQILLQDAFQEKKKTNKQKVFILTE